MTRPKSLTPDLIEQLTLDTDPWLSCDDCFDQVDQEVELLLAGRPMSAGFRAHVRGCPSCHDEAVTLVELVADDRGTDRDAAVALLERAVSGG